MYPEGVYTLSCREKASALLLQEEKCELLVVGGQQALLLSYRVWGNLRILDFLGPPHRYLLSVPGSYFS